MLLNVGRSKIEGIFANFARLFSSYLQQNQDKIIRRSVAQEVHSKAAGRRANTGKLIRTARSIKSKGNMRLNHGKQVTEMLLGMFLLF